MCEEESRCTMGVKCVIRNVIEKRRIEIGMCNVMKLSFLENEVTKIKM